MHGIYKSGSHTVWDCKYRLVWTTKYRYQVLGGDVGLRRRELIQTHTPQQVGMVERLIRTIKGQCIWFDRPDSIGEAN